MKLRTIAASLLACGAVSLAAQEGQDRATIQLRDGTKVEGRIEELGRGILHLRVSLPDQRKIPVSEVALIDRRGGASGLPDTELREARGADHLLLLVGGSSSKGRLVGISGGEGSGQDNQPRTYVFRTLDGREHRYGQADVARIYMGSYPFDQPDAKRVARVTPTVIPPGAIRVPGSADWILTGVSVQKGDRLSLATTGEVQLSDNPADRTTSAGSARLARQAPMPEVPAGALIGRIGPFGRPFGVGDQTSIPMPETGMLYLAVNDDERRDNVGEFVVVLAPPRRR